MRLWKEAYGNYLMHLRLRQGGDLPGPQATEVVIELRDGRTFRLSEDGSRTFVQFVLKSDPSLDDMASRLQELSQPELQGTNVEIWHYLKTPSAAVVGP